MIDKNAYAKKEREGGEGGRGWVPKSRVSLFVVNEATCTTMTGRLRNRQVPFCSIGIFDLVTLVLKL